MSSFISEYGFLIALFPLAGAALNGLLGRGIQKRFGEKAIGYTASGAVFLSFLVALAGTASVASSSEPGRKIVNHLYTWLSVGHLRADISFLFDPLSAVMTLVVTGVGFLIHVYSMGYMKGDEGYYRFFSYLNLFIFSMLVLVLGENLFMMFIGWEGVGLCSYLLISFWYAERENAIAGNKAFIVNRVGDLGFLIGMLMLYWTVIGAMPPGAFEQGSGPSVLSFVFLEENIHLVSGAAFFNLSAATVICLCLFVGAAGKSAQIPLYVWLPDAMAGPTPVSALIHAATMVTAGVYMIGRLNFLFSLSPDALGIIATVGALTALFASTIGCAQNDIKKVLAYSTVSQLGYMFMAMGAAAYSAGIFHLVTHAFFKACLFLGAGSVIIGMHHEQDLRNMGGLRHKMPLTFWTFAISAIAISGIPPFSGFFSKDEILWSLWKGGHRGLWLIGFVSAGLTAFYMTRLLMLAFFGSPRHGHPEKVHESPFKMTVPLIILAGLAAVAGFLGVPEALLGGNRFAHFLSPVFAEQAHAGHHDPMEYVLMAASVIWAACGIALGIIFYLKRPEIPGIIVKKAGPVYRLVLNKYYIDEVYGFVFVKGSILLSRLSAAFDRYVIDLIVDMSAVVLKAKAHLSGLFDNAVVDGAVNFTADSVLRAGAEARKVQTGRVQSYTMLFIALVAGCALYLAISWFIGGL